MKKALIYSAMVLLAGAMACNKTDLVLSGDGHIRFAPTGVETRALVTNANIQAETFQVYDFIGTTNYIDDQITYNATDAVWDYENADYYLWKAGTHKLFGFTAGAGTLGTDQKVTISKTLTTATADQVDILYSEIVTQDAAAWKSTTGNTPDTPVALNFKHMFAAVSFEIKNESGKAVTLNTVSGPAIKNAGSVTVDYSGNAVSISDVTFAASTTPFAPGLSNVSLADGASVDGLSGAATPDYFVVWPQALPDGEDALTVAFNYTIGTGTDAVVKTANVKLPADTWQAGHKYAFLLTVYPTDVHLIFTVQPWDSGEAGEIDTKTGSINMSNVTWMNTKVKLTEGATETENTVNNSGYAVNMYYKPWVLQTVDGVETWSQYTQYGGYYPAQGYFTVNYPKAGLFKIELIPAYGETEVDPSKYQILIYDNSTDPAAFRAINTDGEDITNNTVYFRIAAAANQDGAQHKAQINILFKPDGSDEWISAYSEVRANYALVIPATN